MTLIRAARLDVAAATVARTRRLLGGEPLTVNLPPCFPLPAGEEAWRAAAEDDPTVTWVMVPAVVTEGVAPVGVDATRPIERGTEWILRPAAGEFALGLGVVVDELVPLRARAGPPAGPEEPDSETLAAVRALAAEFLCGSRERLPREKRPWLFTVYVSRDESGRWWFDGIEPDRTPCPPADDWRELAGPASAPLSDGCPLRRPGEPGAGERLEPADGVISWPVGDELALFLPGSGEMLLLSLAGAYLWAACLDGSDTVAIADELAGVVGQEGKGWAWDQLGSLIEHGALRVVGRGEVHPPPADLQPAIERKGAAPRLALYVEWNGGRVWRGSGTTVLVRTPRSLSGWIESAIALESGRPGEPITAISEVIAQGACWFVRSSHHGPRLCTTPELPALVRWSVLAAASRCSGAVFLEATAFEVAGEAVVLIGPPRKRFAVADAAGREGRPLVADATMILDGRGRIIPIVTHGLRPPATQWLAQDQPLTPGEGGPMVDPDGWLVEPWRPLLPPQGDPISIGRLVLLSKGSPDPTPGEVLRELLRCRTPGRKRIAPEEASQLVSLARLPGARRSASTDPTEILAGLGGV